MTYFDALAPSIYFAKNADGTDDAEFRGFIEEYAALIEDTAPFVLIVDIHDQNDHKAAKAMALFFKQYKEKMASKILAMIYIASNAEEMAEFQKRADKSAKAFPYPIHIAESVEQAKTFGLDVLRQA
ncbi:hypothetical protein [Bartonella sp. LJL80]